tara:strand:+ start:15393 stop:15650 length:258 start_codon:yes stop_codon:yes gene_type:complete
MFWEFIPATRRRRRNHPAYRRAAHLLAIVRRNAAGVYRLLAAALSKGPPTFASHRGAISGSDLFTLTRNIIYPIDHHHQLGLAGA